MMRRLIGTTLLMICLIVTSIAQVDIAELERQYDEATTDTTRMYLLIDLANAYQHSDFGTAITRADAAAALAERLGASRPLTTAWLIKAQMLSQMSRLEEAAAAVEEAASIASDTGDTLRLAKAYVLKGSILYAQGRHEDGIAEVLRSIDLFKKIENKLEEGISLHSIGNMYVDRYNYPRAQEYYLQAAEIFEEGNHWNELVTTYSSLAGCDLPFEERVGYLEKAKGLSREFELSPLNLAFIEYRLGSIYGGEERYADAIPHFEAAIQGWQTAHYIKGIRSAYENLARCYAEIGDRPSAMRYLRLDKDLMSTEYIEPRDEMLSRYFIGEVYGALGMYDSAYTYLNSYIGIADTLLYAQGTRDLTEIETKYKTAEKERLLAEREVAILREQRRSTWLIGGLLVLAALFGGLFYLNRGWSQNRSRQMALALREEQLEREKLQEINQLKSNFFANISHEFRTPLTLILGPLADMMRDTETGSRYAYQRMHRHGSRLLQLVNQLLDLSKLEAGKMSLQVSDQNISRYLRVIAHSYDSMAANKNITYQKNFPIKEIHGYIDVDKVEKILSNLISNAIKYTAEDGQVTLSVDAARDRLRISVQDTGMGISAADLEHVFDRFYRVDDGAGSQMGTGIGLALTQELVEIHRGSISVESEEGRGTLFRVELPIAGGEYAAEEVVSGVSTGASDVSRVDRYDDELAGSPALAQMDAPTVLIVDDTDAIRSYLREILGHSYSILEAADGSAGLEMAIAEVPDMIISDVMMPVMDGYQLTTAVRSHEVVSHIPIIMLTAKADRDDRLQGLSRGVDAYLAKPFDAEELRLIIKNIIDQRSVSQQKNAGVLELRPSEVQVESMNEQFLREVMDIVEANLENEDFAIEDIERHVGMSRSQLYRKIKALTDRSPSVFIRTMRLHRAKDLLEQRAATVTEIAYQMGFSSLPYFTKCFKEEFGITPSQVLD